MSDLSNTNPTNTDSYKSFMENQRKLQIQLEKELKEKRIKKNLIRWKDTLSQPYKNITLKHFKNGPQAYFANYDKTGERKFNSVQVVSDTVQNARLYSYALVDGFLRRGLITPNEVEFTNFYEGTSNIHGMFEAKEWKARIFNSKNKIIVVDGGAPMWLQSVDKNYKRFLKELVAFASTNNIIIISTFVLNDVLLEYLMNENESLPYKKRLIRVSRLVKSNGKQEFSLGMRVAVLTEKHIKEKKGQ